MLKAPFSSEFDPSEEAEGSIDPLGLAPVYERLADRLLPAVTVRLGRPRFVTAMAIGACICERWDSDSSAADGITPPWLVWEAAHRYHAKKDETSEWARDILVAS